MKVPCLASVFAAPAKMLDAGAELECILIVSNESSTSSTELYRQDGIFILLPSIRGFTYGLPILTSVPETSELLVSGIQVGRIVMMQVSVRINYLFRLQL
jgi:hypothetical protein